MIEGKQVIPKCGGGSEVSATGETEHSGLTQCVLSRTREPRSLISLVSLFTSFSTILTCWFISCSLSDGLAAGISLAIFVSTGIGVSPGQEGQQVPERANVHAGTYLRLQRAIWVLR